MEHFSRLLLWKFGQEFTSRTGSMFRRQVDRTSSGRDVGTEPRNALRAPRDVATALARQSKWSRARDTRFRDFRSEVGSRARGVVRGVPRFFKIEISNDVWRKMMLKMEFFRRRKELDANGWMKRERNWICFEYCIIM